MHKYPVVVEPDGRPLINFERYTRFMGRIKETLLHKPPDLERFRSQGQLSYLEHQLRSVKPGDVNSEDALEARSIQFEAAEKKIYDRREREMRSVGLKT